MSVAGQYIDGGFAVAKRDFLLFMSYRTVFASRLFQAIFSLTLFYYLSRLLNPGDFASPDAYYAFVVVGLVVVRLLIATIGALPTMIRQELLTGTFERMLLSPLGPVGGVVGMAVFPFLLELVIGALMILFAAIVFGLSVEWSTATLSVPAALLAAFAFAPIALLLAAVVLTFKQAAGAASAVIALVTIVAGFYFPVTILPDWIQWAAEVQPFTPAVDLLRHLLVGTPLADPAWLVVAKLASFAAVLSALSIAALRAAVELSQRRGTIIEY